MKLPRWLRNKRKRTKQWLRSHPEKVKEYDQKYLRNRAVANAKRRIKNKVLAIQILGGKCSSRHCKWLNEDGSTGCKDFRILQFDHKDGGGTKERMKHDFDYLCRQIVNGERHDIQLLCANCNWLKARRNKEFKYKYGSYHDLARNRF